MPVLAGARRETVSAHLVLQSEETRPATLDERVVGSDNGDDVNALGLELVRLLEEGWQVVRVACRLEEYVLHQWHAPTTYFGAGVGRGGRRGRMYLR